VQWRAALGAVAAALCAAGCQTTGTQNEHPSNAALRPIQSPSGTSRADRDRAALARFVGVWTFSGWSVDPNGNRAHSAGLAAAAIEDDYFVLIDIRATAGQLGGRAGRKGGSMLLASEPEIGVTLTAWGDASPSVNRLIGRTEGEGASFVFDEAKTPGDRHRLSLNVTFETDDRWTAEIRDITATGRPLIASYTFNRSKE
jgi:hypothetical protein